MAKITFLMFNVSLVYTKSGEGEKKKSGEGEEANFVFKGEGFSLNLGFKKFWFRQWIQSYFRFYKTFEFTR